MDKNKSQKKLSKYRRLHKALREGLNFSDYFDDSVPYEVKPVPSLIPMQEDDYPIQAKDLFKGLWEDVVMGEREYWLDSDGRFYRAMMGHQQWAEEYLDEHNIPYSKYDAYSEDDSDPGCYLQMYKLKFMRIVTYNETISARNVVNPPTNTQVRKLRDSAIESDLRLSINGDSINLLESLNESADGHSLDKFSSYWLDSQGIFHLVGLHVSWAMKYFKTHSIEYDPEEVYKSMYKLGFVRVRVTSVEVHFEYQPGSPPTPTQMRNLRDAAIELRAGLYDDIRDRTVDLNESKYVDKGNKQLFIESMNPDNMDTFKSHLAQLFAYLQKELQLKTVPKVKLISDEKNADKVLGKTAYYNPDKREVALYIVNRHQKDILRSFAHEVIHHWQHENEKLQSPSGTNEGSGAGDPQYAQKNPWLRQMEKQAYLLGNIMFRDWEDQKKAKDKKAGVSDKVKKISEKTSLIGTQYPPRR